MSGATKTPAARYKLIQTFFWIVRAAGISEENWRAVVERLYKKDSLKLLTTDELKCAVDELAACTGVELRKALPKQPKAPRENITVTRNGVVIELPTKEQLALVEDLSGKMNMTQETLQHLIRKAGGDPALGLLSARKLIEMLKYMHNRGWMDHPVEKKRVAWTVDKTPTAGSREN